MANGYVINIGSASAIQWNQFGFEKTLNGMGNGQIALDGIPSSLQSEYDVDKEISFYKNGNFKFRGLITYQDALVGGGIILTFSGIELQLADEKAPMTSPNDTTRIWNSTSDNLVFSTLITSISGWSVDTSNSTSIVMSSFRVTATDSVWNSVIRLIQQTGKDIWIDQENKKVYLYDEYSRSDKFSFIEGMNAENISRNKSRSKAGRVIVYGKGDGQFQIKGSFGSSTPVHTIIDKNVASISEANTRAEKEYDRLNPQNKNYSLTPTILVDDLQVGDSGLIQSNSAGISEPVDITRLKFIVQKIGIEKVTMQVTNPELRISTKILAETISKDQSNFNNSQSAENGAPNTVTWGSGINANNAASLKVGFQVSSLLVEDQAGNLQIASLTLDYDIDPFNKQYGDATFDGSDPQVQNFSGDEGALVSGNSGSTAPSVSGTSGNGGTESEGDESNVSDTGLTITGVYSKVVDINPDSTDTGGMFVNLSFGRIVTGDPSDFNTIEIEIRRGTTVIINDWEGFVSTDDSTGKTCANIAAFIPEDTSSYTYDVYARWGSSSGATSESDWRCKTGFITLEQHDHSDGSYAASNHSHDDGSFAASDHDHPDGSYDINAADLDHISIGDSVSEGSSVNATSVDIYLDYWNGSIWVNKHSILATGKTLDKDVDISNGGLYPDVTGYWRVRILTNNSNADLVQGIVRMKYQQEA